MNTCYDDIIEKLGTPVWFDENAVPRYCEFDPWKCANIYAFEVVLLAIECQGCAHEFAVCMSLARYEQIMGTKGRALADMILDGSIHYGDPPNIGCCAAGPSMNSVPLRVLEYHSTKERSSEFKRNSDLEIKIDAV